MMSERTILVTGGAGLLGHALLEQLHVESRVALDSARPRDPLDRVVYVDADLRDASRVRDIVRGYGVTDVLHAGGI